jgi:hypothetical protein
MTNEDKTQQERLNEPFREEQIKQQQGFDYVSVGDVIRRMNTVLGTGGWSSQVMEDQRLDNDIVVRVQVTAVIDGKHCVADGFGGASRNPRGWGDTFKSASSDALKKACQRLGVGLHLAVDELHDDEPSFPPVDSAEYKKVNDYIGTLSDAQRSEIGVWWKNNGTGTYNAVSIDPETWDKYKAIVRGFKVENVQEVMSADDVAADLGGEVVEAF